jgi:hypothetical protein
VSRYKVYGEQVTSQGILNFKGTKERSRYNVFGHLLRAGANRKKCDKQMHFIVRVMCCSVKNLSPD